MAKSSDPSANALQAFELLHNPTLVALKPIYVVFGDEGFLRASALKLIRRCVLGQDGDEFGYCQFDGKSAALADVMDELAMLPFFGGKRFVAVQDADNFVSAHREALERYIQKPHRSGVLLLLVQSWPSNTRLAKSVAQIGMTVNCKSPEERQLAPWCSRWAKDRYGKQLRSDSARLLVELVGNGLGQLDSELDKLAAYVGPRSEITAKDVDQLVASGRVETVWKIVDAATAGDCASALELLDRLVAAGEYPLLIFGSLSSQLRRLAKAHQLVAGGEPPRSALMKAGMPPFFVEKAQAQLRQLGNRRLGRLFDWLCEIDLGLKGETPLDPRQLLERLVIQIGAPVEQVLGK